MDSATLLRNAGLSATKQRIALLEVLHASAKPRSAEELAKKLHAKMNQTTVYRALRELVESGLARRIELGENHARYEAARSHHHHLVCRSCGHIEDIEDCLPASLTTRILKETGFARIEDHALEFFGLCTTCDTKKR